MSEAIACAAIRHIDTDKLWSAPRPARHHNLIHTIFKEIGRTVGSKHVQGFLTTTGRFVDRHEAFKIAKEVGQLSPDDKGDTLISEDLW